ncbi:Pisatin demethylase [Echria macrotheca]|uniref:Pisatin demethylase n=1 Tax=Echria macrotheca TaxID=438768 RepID=A0AAJ0B4Z9_9PEZI|nr:Pisatin demethylase [Echria macrotheca]
MESSGGLVHKLGALLPSLKSLPFLDLFVAAVAIGVATVFAWYALAWATSPLRQFPGPFLAGWTNFWRFAATLSGRYPLKMVELHKKYGPVVRIGPNTLVLNYPELIQTIYRTDKKYPKTEMYHSSSAKVDGKIQYTLFATTDAEAAAQMKRPIVKQYNWASTLALEPHVDTAIHEFCSNIDRRFVDPKIPCDLWEWSLYFAWDLSGALIFSRPFGYLAAGRDFDNTIRLSSQVGDYFAMVSPVPWLDFLLDKNPVVKIGTAPFISLATLVVNNIMSRAQGKDTNFSPSQPDYLQYFLDAKQQNPDVVDDATVVGYAMVHVIAGADTSAITICAVLYLALKHPAVYDRLVAEVRGAGIPVDKPLPYSVCKSLSYLDAVIREAMRLQPVVGSQMERYVPPEGLALPDGRVVPPGTAVGLNPYVVGQNTEWFGEDAGQFRPERWLKSEGESDEVFAERYGRLAAADINFGAGERTCLGKNLGLVEVYKTVGTLVNRYEIRLAEPDKEWEITGSWVRKPKRVVVRFGRRQ